ncbi:MAG TPA: DUF2889 domain-containing protein [Arenibaculum sp.]|nr:DUF2889 domain-containing protein [Arenibaculum sp.]
MPLSDPAPREPLHTRTVTCRGYRRADGQWDVEGRITDVKAYAFDNDWRGKIEPGDPIHDMWIRLTVTDGLEITAVEAVTEKSPFEICGGITPNFQRLVGLRIGTGWTRAVRERLGGVEGCTHLVELLGPVATTAFQTIFPARARDEAARGKTERPGKRPFLLNTCHAFRSDGPIVRKQWPEFHTPANSTQDP